MTKLCDASEIEPDEIYFQYIMQLFSEKFGKFIKLLEEKPDFHLFCLIPVKGAYVAGFGQAFSIDSEDLKQIHHVNDSGHKASSHSARQQEIVQG